MKQVAVLVGAGSIGQAIIRRVSAGKHIVLADYSLEHAEQAADSQAACLCVTDVFNFPEPESSKSADKYR